MQHSSKATTEDVELLKIISASMHFDTKMTIFHHVSRSAQERIIFTFLKQYMPIKNVTKNLRQYNTRQKIDFCHALKGNAGNVGASLLSKICSSVHSELSCKRSVNLTELIFELNYVTRFLSELLNQPNND